MSLLWSLVANKSWYVVRQEKRAIRARGGSKLGFMPLGMSYWNTPPRVRTGMNPGSKALKARTHFREF